MAHAALGDGTTASLPFAPGNAMQAHDGRDIVLGIRSEAITDVDGADRNSQAIHTAETERRIS